MRFKIGWASLIVGSKFSVFSLFYFIFEGNFPSTSPRGGLYLEGRFNGGFLALRVWGAYTWRGLFAEFYNCFVKFKGWIANIFVFSYESHLSSVTGLFSRLRQRLIFNRPRPGP